MKKYKITTIFVVLAYFAITTPIAARMYEVPKSFSQGLKSLADVQEKRMPPVDVKKLKAEDAERARSPERPTPYRFAFGITVNLNTDNAGSWNGLPDGSRLWRLKIVSTGALSLNLGFTRFDMPEGAKLWLYNPAGDYVEGPYMAKHCTQSGQLWTPVIPGDAVVVELWVPNGVANQPVVEIGRVNHGYRKLIGPDKVGADKQGACNFDVICPPGNPWRDQIRAVAKYTIDGMYSCTGQLVNNSNEDFTPYFLSAFHCGVDAGNDDTLVFYWNYESPNCGDLSGGSLADNQTGATYRAGWANSDFLLVELDAQSDPVSNVYYAGWNATGTAPSAAVTIHHPSGDEKAISFENNGLTITAYLSDTVDASGRHWRVGDWDAGTTEPGSSGACLYDPSDGLCIGQLHGGYAACGNDDPDWYGRLADSWTGGGTAATRLRDWLNPANDGALTLAGIEGPGGAGPILRIAEAVLDYGDVELDFAFTKALVVYNDGDAPLTISVTNISGADPDLPQWPTITEAVDINLPVGTDPVVFQQIYEPQILGAHSILLQVTSNDPANPSQNVTLTGTGIAPIPIDTVLVLDRSGSMSETAGVRRKIDAMRDAADLYTHLLRRDIGATGTGDKIGYVKYNHTNSIYLSLDFVDDPVAVGSHVADAEDKLSNAALSDAARLQPTGATGIGGAMQTAAGMYTVPAGDRKHVMVVLTDGIENRTPYINTVIGPIQAANPDLSMYSVGVGSNIEPTKLQAITNIGNGYHQVSDDLSGVSIFDLETFYFKIFSNATGMDLVVDPTFAVPVLGNQPIVVDTARITSSDRRAIFLTLDTPALRKLYDLELVAPNGDIIGPGATVAGVGVQYTARNTYRIIKVVLPDAAANSDFVGDWKLRLTPKGGSDPEPVKALLTTGPSAFDPSAQIVPIGFATAVASNFRMRIEVLPSGYLPGADVLLTASLTDRGWPATSGRVSVDVTRPDGRVIENIQLVDDGTHGDQIASDGTWTGRFVQTGASGSYGFVFRAAGRNHAAELVPREASRFVTLMQSPTDPAPSLLDCIPCNWLWVIIIFFFILVVLILMVVILKRP